LENANIIASAVFLQARFWATEIHSLAPHHIRTFKLSTDLKFAEKLKDVVDLYVDPPAHAVVLSVDERSQIQALDRTQPGLPMKPGRAGNMTHDCNVTAPPRCSQPSTPSMVPCSKTAQHWSAVRGHSRRTRVASLLLHVARMPHRKSVLCAAPHGCPLSASKHARFFALQTVVCGRLLHRHLSAMNAGA
jgi:hypothetical protein